MTSPLDVLSTLDRAGFDLAALTEDQLTVLRGLTPEELALLVDIQARLTEAGPDVQAHSEIAGGALF